MLIRLILDPADEHRSGANQIRQWLTFQEHSRRGNAASHPDRRATLFLGYFVFDCMSWLIRESFGIAAGFALEDGWIISNFIGIAVLLGIFVMTHVIAALMSFRLVALLPHHLPRLVGFTPANQRAPGPQPGLRPLRRLWHRQRYLAAAGLQP
jgi:hypothetical protein